MVYMTIYNINIGLGWASSGVEYAQAYRANIFNQLGVDAKFIFTDMFNGENMAHFASNLGFKLEDVIWLYQYFSDIKIAPTTFTLADFKQTLADDIIKEERDGKIARLYLSNDNSYVTAYLSNEQDDYLQRAEFVSKGILIRKDYYSYTRVFSEYFLPHNQQATVYQRRFFNEDGTTALEEIPDGDNHLFKINNRIFYSKETFIAYFMQCLQLTSQDIVLIDRSTGIGQAVLENKGQAKVGTVIHAEHFNEPASSDKQILWNNYYEYQFTNRHLMDFFVTATEVQKDLLNEQFMKENGETAPIYAIPVGSLDELKKSDHNHPRQSYALVTASRLAEEKHIDWLIDAVALAKGTLKDLTFDIYGEGGTKGKLSDAINAAGANDYIHLKGHQDLTNIYTNYAAYLSASTSEGFGLTLMEAVGSGLPIIGFDVRYGNQTFIRDGENGFLIAYEDQSKRKKYVQEIADAIIRLFEGDIEASQATSYDVGAEFLTENIKARWTMMIKELLNDSTIK